MAEAIFQEAIRKFKSNFGAEEEEWFQFTTLQDVKKEILNIQQKQTTSKSMAELSRIEPFIEAMEQFSRVIEMFLNTSSILCFVWGPLKRMLLTVKSSTYELSLLLERYQRIGEQIPLVERFEKLVQHSSESRELLGSIFSEVLEFHQLVSRCTSRPLYEDFETPFCDILARLTRHNDDLVRLNFQIEASQDNMHQPEQDEVGLLLKLDRMEQDRIYRRFVDTMRWIDPDSLEGVHEHHRVARAKHSTEGRWILNDGTVVDWMKGEPPQSSILWLKGGLGTGKTVAASVIIDECKLIPSARTAYFYCHEEQTHNLLVLRTLLSQLITPKDELMQYIWEQSLDHQPVLQSAALAERLLLTLMQSDTRIFLVVDGIDECHLRQRHDIIATLTKMVRKMDSESPGRLRLLIVSRELGDLREHLAAFPSVSLNVGDNEDDIRRYVVGELGHSQRRFDLSDSEIHTISNRIVQRAEGMFLYATLTTDNLSRQLSRNKVFEELDVLPMRLKYVYEYTIYRMRSDLGPRWDVARKLLGWMACAKRPLRWREIQSIISIDVDGQTMDFNKSLRIGISDLAAPLVREHWTGEIKLVNSSVKSYLSESGHVQIDLAKCELTALCLHYLTFGCFQPDLDDTQVRQYVDNGVFALQDYVAAKWMYHVQDLLHLSSKAFWQKSTGLNHQRLLAVALHDFITVFQDEFSNEDILFSASEDCKGLKSSILYDDIVRVWNYVLKHQRDDLDTRNTIVPSSLSKAVTRSRSILEDVSRRSRQDQLHASGLVRYYGPKVFKCPKVTCFYFHEGFQNAKSRDKHVKQHDRPFRCWVHDCISGGDGFDSNTRLEKHIRQFHDELNPLVQITTSDPKNKLFACHLCAKKFTRRINLDMHLRYHSGEKPFECSECGKAFTRVNDCRRHEKTIHSVSMDLELPSRSVADVSDLPNTKEPVEGYLHSDSGYKSGRVTSTEHEDAYQVDVASVYSDTGSIGSVEGERFADDFASHLVNEFEAEVREAVNRLPQLLKSFAMRLGYAGKTDKHRDIMVVTGKYKTQICDALKNKIQNNRSADDPMFDDEPVEPSPLSSTKNDQSIDIDLWRSSIEDSSTMTPSKFADYDSDDERGYQDEEIVLDEIALRFEEYQAIVIDSPAYRWLSSSLCREALLIRAEPPIETTIYESLMKHTYASELFQRISRNRSPPTCVIVFEAEWIIATNLEDYEVGPFEAMETAITITGDPPDVQALPCAEYLSQTWSDLGTAILELMQRVICIRTTTQCSSSLSDGTTLVSWRAGNRVFVEASGVADSVCEVGEALAWLTSALSGGEPAVGGVVCAPFVRRIEHSTSTSHEPPTFKAHYVIQHRRHKMHVAPSDSSGVCWHSLLSNFVVVRGFPIPRRSHWRTGMEAPLSIMANLAHATRAVVFKGRFSLKGFCSMLIPVLKMSGVVFWHMVLNEDGSYLRFLDDRARIPAAESMVSDVAALDHESTRHILGWCSVVENCAGAPSTSQVNYDIERASLPKAHSKLAFDKVTITCGKVITGGVTAAVRKKDKPIYFRPDIHYVGLLKEIERMYVVLHDVSDRRAWLVNGLSALLHLLRASLHEDQNDLFSSEFMLSLDDLEEPADLFSGKSSAAKFLASRVNRELKLFENSSEIGECDGKPTKKTSFFCLSQRIDQIGSLLLQLSEHQGDIHSEDGAGFRVRTTPRRQLEGFHFSDIAQTRHKSLPQVVMLKRTGFGWVDLVRDIDAITLFGQGFGDIFRPQDPSALCPGWRSMPKEMDNLAVSASDLTDIVKRYGGVEKNALRVSQKMFWRMSDGVFEVCKCHRSEARQSSARKSCDRVQVLVPWMKGAWESQGHLERNRKGAVIFGHSWKCPMIWGDGPNEDPVRATPSDDPMELDDSATDSGIGPSAGSSATT